jgi:group I intron endonuclease
MQYFNFKNLKRKEYMYISRSNLKFGLSNFSLAVIEYCEQKKCIERENYYISFFKPEYNILQKAGSSLGFKHSLATREKLKISQKLVNRTGKKNHRFGIVVNHETQAKLFAASKDKCQKIEVMDLNTNETTIYESIRAAGKALDIKQSLITTFFSQNQKSSYKGRYIFKKVDMS